MLVVLTESEAKYLEGYAKALDSLIVKLTGSSYSAKRYDPLTVQDNGTIMASYAFDMKDGGRAHPVADYASFEEILEVLSNEAFVKIKFRNSIEE